MHIEIEIPRPALTAALASLIIGSAVWFQYHTEAAAPVATVIEKKADTQAGQLQADADQAAIRAGTSPDALPMQNQQNQQLYPLAPYNLYGAPAAYPQPLPYMYGMQPPQPYPASAWTYPQQPYAGMVPARSAALSMQENTDTAAVAEQKRADAESALRDEKMYQELVANREAILRDQLTVLERESKKRGGSMTPDEEQRFSQSVRELTSLLQDKARSEQFLIDSYKQIQESEADLRKLTENQKVEPKSSFAYMFPVEPLMGISAFFHDPGYFKHFGFQHNAIDIPTPQGTEVHAAGPGVVVKAKNNGLGYNSIIVQHSDGRSTEYGHVSKILVQEGQSVAEGDVIALSGGDPGTPGAGAYTTGAHVHFALYEDGKAVNPLDLLPALK
ncbi:MAG: peptidase [Candidatus Peribacteria bacterium]|nr:peptidase [Candidatus Peribacteria bacterium]